MEHSHVWSKTGLWEAKTDKAIYPCTSLDCPAALLKTPGQDISTGTVLPDRLAKVVKEFEGFTFEDDPTGGVVKVLMTEVVESYKFHKMKFKPGDVVIDIGAHVGVISIYLAKKYGVNVYAFEPVMENYERLIANIDANSGVYRIWDQDANGGRYVAPMPRAVTGDGLPVEIRTNLATNSAGSSAWISPNDKEGEGVVTVESITLTDIIDKCGLRYNNSYPIRLLKIDCEGAEYDILENTPADVLAKIESVRGEFHTNKRLRKAGHKPAALRKWLKQFVGDVRVTVCKMAE